jgi:linalool 8-monooxygenase
VPVDVVPALSIPFPLQVICELLGVDGEQWPRFFEWSEAVIPGESESSRGARSQQLQAEMWEYLIGVAE